MFTGIVTAIGRVVERRGGRFVIATPYAADGIALGASIAHDGCCLTVTALRPEGTGSIYELDVSNETLAHTTLGDWQAGRELNLERSLKAGDEFGGHVVSGHVDAVAEILSVREDGNSRRFSFRLPDDLAPFVAPKGSIALDGTSLTVNEVDGASFGVNLIPHSLTVTTWGRKRPGDRVNVEIDMLARYVARLVDARLAASGSAQLPSGPAPRTA